ncbi:MAG: AMP-binding protein, partial [Burkholderiaceae bacterium]
MTAFVPWPEARAARYRAAGLWEGLTVAEMVERTARELPHKVALVHGERRIGYAEMVDASKRLAGALLDLGLARGERVVVQLPNVPEFVLVYLALQWIGAIPVTALRAHRHAELRHFIAASGASAYVIADRVGNFDYRPMADEMRAHFGAQLREVLVAGEPAPARA